jgi:hypothetical protein
MAIQVENKKKKVKLPKSLDILFNFSLALIIIVVASYFFVDFLVATADETREKIENEIANKRAEIPEKEELEEVVRNYFNLIEDYKVLVENQRIISSFFPIFEEMIHPEVNIANVTFNSRERRGQIIGAGSGFVAVGQQFSALKENKNISSVRLENLNTSEEDNRERVAFVFSINFVDGLFGFKNLITEETEEDGDESIAEDIEDEEGEDESEEEQEENETEEDINNNEEE